MKKEACLIFAASLNNLERGLVEKFATRMSHDESGVFVLQLPEGARN